MSSTCEVSYRQFLISLNLTSIIVSFNLFNLFKCNRDLDQWRAISDHIETSQLICIADKRTGFSMMEH